MSERSYPLDKPNVPCTTTGGRSPTIAHHACHLFGIVKFEVDGFPTGEPEPPNEGDFRMVLRPVIMRWISSSHAFSELV